MKNFALVGFLILCGWYLASCQAPKVGEEGPVQTAYQCPSCKETVKWRYNPQKPWIKEGKEVVHVCPDCQRAWGSNMSVTSTCAVCGDAHATCPICARH